MTKIEWLMQEIKKLKKEELQELLDKLGYPHPEESLVGARPKPRPPTLSGYNKKEAR